MEPIELKYKIVDVNPLKSLDNIGAIQKNTSQWYTNEAVTTIQINFATAFVQTILIKNYNSDQVNLIIRGDNNERHYDSVINKNNRNWDRYQEAEIQISNDEIYYELIIEVLNFEQREFKGLKYVKIFGLQDDKIAKDWEKTVKIQKQKERKEKKGQSDNKKEEKGQKFKQKAVDDQPSQIKKHQWQQYYREQSSQQNNANNITFSDARLKLRNVQRSPSPIFQKQQQFELILIEEDEKQPEKSEKLGSLLNDQKMIRYHFNEIDESFLILHNQCIAFYYDQIVQISSGRKKEDSLNQMNFDKLWLV